MSSQTIIFLLLGVVIIALAAISAFFISYSYRINKKINSLLEQGKIKDHKDIFLLEKEKSENLEEKIKDAFKKIKNLEDTCETTIQKIAVVRFNPFNDQGGNQSFAVALLDNQNNGFIISSLFVNDGNRVYAKTIKQGKSDYTLSKEETEAIGKAIDKK